MRIPGYFWWGLHDTYGNTVIKGSIYSPFMFDAMYLYGLALNKTLDAGLSQKDGIAVFDKARNIQFRGMSGHVVIDQWSIRKPVFVIKGFDSYDSYTILADLKTGGDGEVLPSSFFTLLYVWFTT